MSVSLLTELDFESRLTGCRVDCRILSPADADRSERLPLILHLHGAMSSAAFLEGAKPIYDDAWTSGRLPRSIVACASTPTMGGFYIDHPGGPSWERFISSEWPDVLAQRYPLSDRRGLVGFSMGGYGALKLAMRAPERYRAVAALCPAIFPAEQSDKVPEKNRPAILGDLNRTMGETAERYGRNCVQTLLRSARASVRTSGLGIYLECGQQDEFGLHDGSLHLHRLLTDLKVPHVWRSLQGVGHMDDGPRRLSDALGFLGEALGGHAARLQRRTTGRNRPSSRPAVNSSS